MVRISSYRYKRLFILCSAIVLSSFLVHQPVSAANQDEHHVAMVIASEPPTTLRESPSSDSEPALGTQPEVSWLDDEASWLDEALQMLDEVEAVKAIDVEHNVSPVAKFTLDKESYHIGEEVIYTNLSYDPDGDAVFLSWSGKQRAFFTAGQHEITLVAIDANGYESEPYTKIISVRNEQSKQHISEFEFFIDTSEPGDYTEGKDVHFLEHALRLPEAKKKIRAVEQRKLLVSDSPENITESGILYQDDIKGKARLYANHVNASQTPLKLAIMATNRTDEVVTLYTNRLGHSAPSKLAMLVGSEAVLDLLSESELTGASASLISHEKVDRTLLQLAPGETITFWQLPILMPQYGINAIVDVESSEELLITFLAVPEDEELGEHSLSLTRLPFRGHVRGSFPTSTIKWEVYPHKSLNKRQHIQRITIGDDKRDPFLRGHDRLLSKDTILTGNYGATYDITIQKPGKMAVLLMARGGVYKGAFKVNGQFVRAPASGVLPPFQGVVTVAKTNGSEKSLTIEFIPPAGSSLPILLLLYPLDK